jgi:signal transduction histidine kinase
MPIPDLRSFDVAPSLHQALGDSNVPAGIETEVDCPAGLPPALADAGQIRIALGNLIRNACEAMPSGGRLTLRGRGLGDAVEVAVIDTGVGIAPDDLGRIMEPLYSTKARGLGLGLALVRMIVERNGGAIQVASESGRGSTFTVRLAVAPQGGPTP